MGESNVEERESGDGEGGSASGQETQLEKCTDKTERQTASGQKKVKQNDGLEMSKEGNAGCLERGTVIAKEICLLFVIVSGIFPIFRRRCNRPFFPSPRAGSN